VALAGWGRAARFTFGLTFGAVTKTSGNVVVARGEPASGCCA
jgi:hypothetical protein